MDLKTALLQAGLAAPAPEDFRGAVKAVGFTPPPPPASRRQKLTTLLDPRQWQRFVRRHGRRDGLVVKTGGVTWNVTLLTERRYLIAVAVSGRMIRHTVGQITRQGIHVPDRVPSFRPLEAALIDGLYELIVEARPEREEAGPTSLADRESNGRRAHWRRLTGRNGHVAHSFPPDFLILSGVPRFRCGHTFVHETATA